MICLPKDAGKASAGQLSGHQVEIRSNIVNVLRKHIGPPWDTGSVPTRFQLFLKRVNNSPENVVGFHASQNFS